MAFTSAEKRYLKTWIDSKVPQEMIDILNSGIDLVNTIGDIVLPPIEESLKEAETLCQTCCSCVTSSIEECCSTCEFKIKQLELYIKDEISGRLDRMENFLAEFSDYVLSELEKLKEEKEEIPIEEPVPIEPLPNGDEEEIPTPIEIEIPKEEEEPPAQEETCPRPLTDWEWLQNECEQKDILDVTLKLLGTTREFFRLPVSVMGRLQDVRKKWFPEN